MTIIDGYGEEVPDDEFVERWEHYAHATAHRLVGQAHPSYDDFVQEGMIRAWRTGTDKPEASAAYVAKAVKMRVLQVVEGKQPIGGDTTPGPKHRATLVGVDWSSPECPVDEPQGGQEALEAVEWGYHAGAIQQALEALSAEDREYVVRRFWGQETDTEIGEALGVPGKVLGNRWKRRIQPKLSEALVSIAA